MDRLPYWLLFKSWKWILIVLIPFMISGFVIGFGDAWEILVGRSSARNAGWPAVTWPLSVLGWLVVPAFIAGVVGYIVSRQISDRHENPTGKVARELHENAPSLHEGGP
ncbi:DUF6313 family protein [Kitasatospora sp. NPDC057904]|uniref:DUF6313 family protein n=1 Tax=unclassified Kitasatospora TaxID=2633591 RepID=UPI0036D78E26